MTFESGVTAFDQRNVSNPEAHKLEPYPLFDWLRFVLASIVALGHEGVRMQGPIDASLAVTVFLALSGWLIGGILLRSHWHDLPRFYFNRATRIWLPYLASFALIYGLAALRDGIDFNWLKYAFYDATFTHYTWTVFPRAATELPLVGTGNHFWSISVEEQFYLLAPAMAVVAAWGKRLAPWLAVSVALLAFGSVFAPIALGVTAAVVQREHGDWQQRRWGIAFATGTVLATFVAAWLWDAPQLRALFAVALVVALAQCGRRERVGLFLGAISYPLYLNAWIGVFAVNLLTKHMALPDTAHKAITYVASIAAAIVSWTLVDRVVMARRSQWFTRERGRVLGLAAYTLLFVGLVGGSAIRLGGG